jgi:hypothetical protein
MHPLFQNQKDFDLRSCFLQLPYLPSLIMVNQALFSFQVDTIYLQLNLIELLDYPDKSAVQLHFQDRPS